MFNLILYLYINYSTPNLFYVQNVSQVMGVSAMQLASRSFSMEKRYEAKSVNTVFKDNILLTLHYLNGDVVRKEDIIWENIEKPFKFEFILNPNEGFAFHDQILPEYKTKIVKTTNAHFNFDDGFKTDGLLYGNGVCHLASLIYWVAKDAGLETVSLTSHNFAKINEVPKDYGVSIKFQPKESANSARQNLYIINNFDKPVTFAFDYDGTNLTVKVSTQKN